MDNECCAKCRYYHRLKNNFKVGEGFEESHCCDVLLHLPEDESEGWVQEVTPQDRCEMYKEKDHIADADKMIEPTTKNNLVDGKDNNVTSTDCISRQEAIGTIRQLYLDLASQKAVIDILKVLPSVTPQLPSELEKDSKKLENVSPIIDWNNCHTSEQLDSIATTKNDLGVDCISREQAIKQCGFGMTSLLIADNLRKLPPVAPQSRKGHWEHGRELSRVFIGDALRGINYEDWHCSNCHCVIEQSIKPKWNYCPNCGADMREVE